MDGLGLKIGLCYYKDEHPFTRIFLDMDANEIVLEIVNKAKFIERRTSRSVDVLAKGAKVTFGVDYTKLELVFWYRVDAGTKEKLGGIDALDMTGHDFVGPIIGIYAVSDKQCKVRYSDLLLEDLQ